MKDWFATDDKPEVSDGRSKIYDSGNDYPHEELGKIKDTSVSFSDKLNQTGENSWRLIVSEKCEQVKPYTCLDNLREELDYLESELRELNVSPQVYRARASILRVKAILMEVDAWES